MVEVLPMTDMALDADEAKDFMFPTPSSAPRYPYGLSISLCEKELEKLDIDYNDINQGDLVHLHAMAVVTSKSCQETQGGSTCRIELQITHMAGIEDESDEDEEAEKVLRSGSDKRISKLYK